MSKGESLKDTALTLQAMGADAIVIRHSSSGSPHQLTKWVRGHVVNAGEDSTTRWFRRSSTRFSRGTISSCSACAARRRRGSCARSSRCSTRSCPSCRLRDPRRPARAALCGLPRARRDGRRRTADRVAAARSPVRREARDAGRDDRRHDRRRRSDQGRAARPAARRRADDALRPAAARATAASSRSTSCRIWRARCRSACSTSCRKATSRLRAIRCGCALDVALVFSANPEDYTARGKIITPLKDRIGSEIRTHYPAVAPGRDGDHAQEAWTDRGDGARGASGSRCPPFVREVVEEIAFQARGDQKVDKRSGVSQRLPITHARERRLERRAARAARTARRSPCRASATSTPRCRRSPARSSSSTRAS